MSTTMNDDGKAIVTGNLSRTFKSTTGIIRRKTKETTALKDVSLSVERGELFGLLGPNGAGKTTMTKILSTILLPTAGQAWVLGHDVERAPGSVRTRIGIIFGGERGLYWRLTGRDHMAYFADLYKVPPSDARERIPKLLQMVGLASRADERVETYSRGMKQRLHIARGLVNDPEVIFMDEPTLGLDPVVAREMRDVIRSLKAAGKTIFLTSHYMFEMEALCDRVAVLNKGECVLIDTPTALKRLVADLEVVEITVSSVSDQAVEQLQAHPTVDSVAVTARGQTQVIHVHAPDACTRVQEFLDELSQTQVLKVTTREPTLEDAYVKLVGKEALQL